MERRKTFERERASGKIYVVFRNRAQVGIVNELYPTAALAEAQRIWGQKRVRIIEQNALRSTEEKVAIAQGPRLSARSTVTKTLH